MTDRGKYFFKVMIGDFRHQMTIPEKFAQSFRDKIQKRIKLKVCNGNSFTVVVAKYPNKLVLEEGWETFVSIHDLRMGDFLVFRYSGEFQFKVLMFDPSGCVKAPPIDAPNIAHHVQQKQGDAIEISSSSDDQDSQEHAAPACVFHTCLTQVQRMKLQKNAPAVNSNIPMYVAVMTKSNITRKACYMGFGREYANKYLPLKDQMMRLHKNGKRWQVQFRVTKKNLRRLCEGWGQFVRNNKLRIGDTCLFELLKHEKCCTMNVHIIQKL